MASKTKYNIIVGAKLDPKTNISEQIQSAISKTTYKINIDTAHLKSQLDSVLSSMKINVGGGTGGGSAGSGGGSGGITGSGDNLYTPDTIEHAKSITTTINEQGAAIARVEKGYDSAGRAIRNYYKITDKGEDFVRTQKEEGTLANRNAETYQRLSNRLQTLSKNGQITTKQTKKLTEELNKANKITDEFGKQNRFKEIGQNISDASKHAMKFGDMLKTAYEKFAIWSIATVNKLPSLNLSNLTQGCAVKLC